jgi:hypothetical protein
MIRPLVMANRLAVTQGVTAASTVVGRRRRVGQRGRFAEANEE